MALTAIEDDETVPGAKALILEGAKVMFLAKKDVLLPERQVLGQPFPDLDAIVNDGRKEGLPIEDILDATVACWSALRLADGKGRSLVEPVPHDTTRLPMTIWV